MKFLIAGGTGFIGWWVVKNLPVRHIPVVVADRNIDLQVTEQLYRLRA
ncbi:MAG TPA: hypothetical protein VNJ09_09240 [Chthonomonadales bacterium]|nr:hypothetical protein [Chthonomonadales bacterium]